MIDSSSMSIYDETISIMEEAIISIMDNCATITKSTDQSHPNLRRFREILSNLACNKIYALKHEFCLHWMHLLPI